METRFEVVRVLDEHNLVNSESYQCNYLTGSSTGLEPGYYVVIWDAQAEPLIYDERAFFIGPCPSRAEAMRWVQRTDRALIEPLQYPRSPIRLH